MTDLLSVAEINTTRADLSASASIVPENSSLLVLFINFPGEASMILLFTIFVSYAFRLKDNDRL